jgi:hypothetical protein
MKIISTVQNIKIPLLASTWLWFVVVCGVFGGYVFWLGHSTETSQNSELLQYLREENAAFIERQTLLEERLKALQNACDATLSGNQEPSGGGAADAGLDPQRSFTYTVKTGDTIWDIATLYDVDVKALIRWNNLGPRPQIFPGDQLVIMLED